MHIHARGSLHNDLKANNVVIDGAENKPVIIDFGKSCKIVKARLRKPKVNIKKATKKFPHIAPEIHCGEKHSVASDVFLWLSCPAFIQRGKVGNSASPEGNRQEMSELKSRKTS